ncbi:response regulator [Microbulbifer sp. OS29]|uniref:Response regulator n=1 Tax=Microbulbifer okhotskensis TaxID=2926617 RepID=A0A9X2EJ96_9GAMM|nr:response regulator [Microbulbifer okhotskensis]MCO1333257.1 response regulator [Microbulbifer okhotskensis]
MSAKILIVEDETELAHLLLDYLRAANYQAEIISDGIQVIPTIDTIHPDLILLDLMLPGRNGIEICEEIRLKGNDVPIIMMTARVEESDRLRGLESGADDYVCKPYSPRELVARVKAVLRRRPQKDSTDNSGIELDRNTGQLRLEGKDANLTALEFHLFDLLYSEPGRIFSREQIMDRIYSDYRVISDRTIDSHIKKVRKKITALKPDKELIHSVYGAGYKFELQ